VLAVGRGAAAFMLHRIAAAIWVGVLSAVLLAADPTLAGTNVARFKVGVGTYSINGYVRQDVAPYISHNRTYLPLRYAAYAVGIGDNSIAWDPNTKTAYLLRNGVLMVVPVGSPTIRVGDRVVQVDAPAELKDGRVMLPIRAVAELFGCRVDWDSVNRVVTITY